MKVKFNKKRAQKKVKKKLPLKLGCSKNVRLSKSPPFTFKMLLKASKLFRDNE